MNKRERWQLDGMLNADKSRVVRGALAARPRTTPFAQRPKRHLSPLRSSISSSRHATETSFELFAYYYIYSSPISNPLVRPTLSVLAGPRSPGCAPPPKLLLLLGSAQLDRLAIDEDAFSLINVRG